MFKMLWMLIFVSMYTFSCAQSRPPINDNLSIPPNTIRIIGKVKKADKAVATLTILKVKDQGQGLINTLSEGDEITVKLLQKQKIYTGSTIEVYLKEKMEVDASQSTYVLINMVKNR